MLASQHDETGDYAIIRVRDSGVGISSPLLTQILSRSSGVKALIRDRAGADHCQGIIDLHEGESGWKANRARQQHNVRLALQHPAQSGSGAARRNLAAGGWFRPGPL